VGVPVDTTSFSSEFTHDGTLFVASDYTGKISVIRVSDGSIQNTFQAGSDYIRRLSLSIDDRILATEQRYGTIKLWNLHTGKEIKEFDNWSDDSLGVEIAFNPMNSNTLAILSTSSLFLLDVVTNQMVKFELGGYSLAWSPDGQRLAITRADGIHDVTMFDVSSMHPLLELSAKNDLDFITSLKFSSDGLMLAGMDSGSAKVALWDITTGLLRFEVSVPKATITSNISSLAFSLNDLFLVAAGDNPAVVLNVETGESVAKIETNQTALNSVGFTPNGLVLGLGFALLRDPQGRSLENVFQEQ
jgi:WD40 repeat protein